MKRVLTDMYGNYKGLFGRRVKRSGRLLALLLPRARFSRLLFLGSVDSMDGQVVFASK
jgi:hypothetical protein